MDFSKKIPGNSPGIVEKLGVRIINMTGHDIDVAFGWCDKVVHYAPRKDPVPRAVTTRAPHQRSPYKSTVIVTGIENLPSPLPGVDFIVSRETARAIAHIYPERKDFISPGPQFRKNGRVVGCEGFNTEASN